MDEQAESGNRVPASMLSCFELGVGVTLPETTIKIRTVGADGQQCLLEGDAAWAGDIIEHREKSTGSQKECILRLTIKNGIAHIEDVGGVCRERHCGAKVSFDRDFPVMKSTERICFAGIFE